VTVPLRLVGRRALKAGRARTVVSSSGFL